MASRYEDSVTIDRFTGIDESSGAHNVSLSVAAEAYNCLTEQGILRPSIGYALVYPPLNAPIVTLATFYRRNHEVEAERRVLVASTATTVFAMIEGASVWKEVYTGVQGGGRWSWVTYEQESADKTSVDDVLIMSNAIDGFVMVHGETLQAEKKVLDMIGMDDAGNITHDSITFDIIERHAERIWGAGAPGSPDNLYYSQPFNPFDFNQVYLTADGLGVTTTPTGEEVLPEQSGGVIQVPTWDGDKFVAIKRFGNFLLALKERSAFYIRGLAAGEFSQYEAYGSDGILAPRALGSDNAVAYYLSDRGLGIFNGDTAQLLDMDRLGSIFRNLGEVYSVTSCAAVARHVLYLSVPVYTGEMTTETKGNLSITRRVEPTRNNRIVEYDTRRRTYMVRTGISADALLGHGGRLLFTSGDNPSQVYEMVGNTYDGKPIPMRWVSAWQDNHQKNVTKSAFELYITGLECATKQKLTVGIETEKRLKSKTIVVDKKLKRVRFPVGNSGRRYRFVLTADSTEDWSLSGGVQIDMDKEED